MATDLTEARQARRWRWPVLVFVAVAAAVAAAVLLLGPGAEPSLQRASAPVSASAFEVSDLRDETATVALADAAGRPRVVNFWASWCVPCREEMPAFEAVHQRVGDRVAFIGIDNQDSRDDALEFLDHTGVTYPTGFDPKGGVARAYGLFGMPTTVFVSKDGRILARRTGSLTEQQLTKAIRDLFDVAVRPG